MNVTIGSRVHWTKRTHYGRSVNITVHYGTVASITADLAVVLPDSKKRKTQIPLRCLRLAGTPSYLDELLGVAAAPEAGEAP